MCANINAATECAASVHLMLVDGALPYLQKISCQGIWSEKWPWEVIMGLNSLAIILRLKMDLRRRRRRQLCHRDLYLMWFSYPTSANAGQVFAESSWRSGMISGNLQFILNISTWDVDFVGRQATYPPCRVYPRPTVDALTSRKRGNAPSASTKCAEAARPVAASRLTRIFNTSSEGWAEINDEGASQDCCINLHPNRETPSNKTKYRYKILTQNHFI